MYTLADKCKFRLNALLPDCMYVQTLQLCQTSQRQQQKWRRRALVAMWRGAIQSEQCSAKRQRWCGRNMNREERKNEEEAKVHFCDDDVFASVAAPPERATVAAG